MDGCSFGSDYKEKARISSFSALFPAPSTALIINLFSPGESFIWVEKLFSASWVTRRSLTDIWASSFTEPRIVTVSWLLPENSVVCGSVIVISGGMVSKVILRACEFWLSFPASSFARATKVFSPSKRVTSI